MANRAYISVWTKDFSESTMIAQLARFLATVPHSASRPFFTDFTVQPIDPGEPPLASWDLRSEQYGAAQVAALAAQHVHADSAYIAEACWDLWQFNLESLKWKHQPEPLVIFCHGGEYDDGVAAAEGHFRANLGFEHLFTGHAGLLAPGAASNPFDCSDHPVEHTFRQWMKVEANLNEYHARTRENIQQLFDWTDGIRRALPVDRLERWSEGEENFEGRLKAILAPR